MKVAYFTNFLFHHQYPFCELMLNTLGIDFTFVCTEEMTQDRLAMGYEDLSRLPFVICSFDGKQKYEKAMEVARTADVVLFGSTPPEFIYERMKFNKLTFRYCERALRKAEWRRFIPTTAYKLYTQYIRYRKKNLYILSASSYTSHDLALCGFDINKCFKWGYLPAVTKCENIEQLIAGKRKNHIIWVGRFIDCKHPEFALEAAWKLKQKGVSFTMDFIGNGPLLEKSKGYVVEKGLSDSVRFLGALKPTEVREQMDRASIFVFNSDRYEGWGAVVNEAMNSGCAVLVSHVVGSAPFLINQGINGLVYEYGNMNDYISKLLLLLNNLSYSHSLGKEAYTTITEKWNVDFAVPRLIEISKALLSNNRIIRYESGPCSAAENIDTNWIKK